MRTRIQDTLALFALASLTQACAPKITPPTPKSNPAAVQSSPGPQASHSSAPESEQPILPSAPATSEVRTQSVPKKPASIVDKKNGEENGEFEKTRLYLIIKSPGNEIMEAFGHADIEWDADGDTKTHNTIISFSPNIRALNQSLTEQWAILNGTNDTNEAVAKKKKNEAKKAFAATLTKIMKQDLAMSVAFFDSEKYYLPENFRNRKISREELVLSPAQKKQIVRLFPMLADLQNPKELPLPNLRYKYTDFNCSSALRDLILSQASFPQQAASLTQSDSEISANIEEFFKKSKMGVAQVPTEIQKDLSESFQDIWRNLLKKSVTTAIQNSKTHVLLVSRPENLGIKAEDPYYDLVVRQTSFSSFDEMEKALMNGDLVSRFLNLLSLGSEGAIVFNDAQIKQLQEATQSLASDPSLQQTPNRYESMALPIYLRAELAKLINPDTQQNYLKCVKKSEQPFQVFEECGN